MKTVSDRERAEFTAGREVHQQLWEAVQNAQREHMRLSAMFDFVVADEPGRLTAPDVLRIQRAGQARLLAFKRYQDALEKFTEFVVNPDVAARKR
jgi:hypothetical protein